MRTLLGVSLVLFTLVTFTDVVAEESAIDRMAALAQPAEDLGDLVWMSDEFWTDPALHTGKPILKTSTASVPVVYDERRVIEAQKYLRDVSKEIDANMLWADNDEFERNRF